MQSFSYVFFFSFQVIFSLIFFFNLKSIVFTPNLCSQIFDRHARLRGNEHLFRYRAWLGGKLSRGVRAGAHNDPKIVRCRDAQCNTEETP